MIDWTPDAHRVFDEYAIKVRTRLRKAGADPEEVLVDLRDHIHQAAQERGLKTLTGSDVSHMLAAMGEPEPAITQETPAESFAASMAKKKTLRLWLGGVVLPVLALLVQGVTGLSSTFLEPMPTLLHALLIACVPGAMAWGLHELRNGPSRHFARVVLLVDFAFGIALLYTLLFMPLLPLCLIASIFGVGILGLSPLLSWLSLWSMRRRLRALAPHTRSTVVRGGWLALLALLLAELPMFVTGVGLHLADSDVAASEHVGLWILRHLGNEEVMRASAQRRSFEEGARHASLLLFAARMFDPVSMQRARLLYYRATGDTVDGKPSLTRNQRPLAMGITRSGWDDDQGGDDVGRTLDELTLASSRLDVHVKPEDSLAYMEWTQEFRNAGDVARESRAQWQLPEGAVVSRVTLWIDGEAREAAFGATSQVKRAYQEVVAQRRDPLLVTWSGPNTILVQGFPILPKVPFRIRIGITAPLQLDAKKHGKLAFPALVETNYGLPEKLRHHVWVESNTQIGASNTPLTSTQSAKGFAARGPLTGDELARTELDLGVLDVSRERQAQATLGDVCLTAPACASQVQTISQRWVERADAAPKHLAIVIDGSAPLSGQGDAIAALVAGLRIGTRTRVWLADDEPVQLGRSDAMTAKEYDALASQIRAVRFAGGMDDAPALAEALDWLEGREDAQLLWIHGPQGMTLESRDAVEQRVDRSSQPPRWVSLQLAPGPHRLLQALAPTAHITSLRGAAGLARVQQLLAGGAVWTLERDAATEDSQSADTDRASSHVVRLWARDLIAAQGLDETRRAKLAVQQQLVTHVSGAIVLERAEQYERNGLKPVDPTSVPSIPEPALVLMLLLAAALYGFYRLRGRRASCQT